MPDITDKDRGIGAQARGADAGVARAGSTESTVRPPEPLAGPRYWVSEKLVHRVVLKGHPFDFKPVGDGRTGTVEGKGWFSGGHNGTYSISRNEPGSFQMTVKIGTPKNLVEDMDAILSIAGNEAKVSGVIRGDAADPNRTARVSGNGTAADPFTVEFPSASVEWYVSK
jgi:hypothetical protein